MLILVFLIVDTLELAAVYRIIRIAEDTIYARIMLGYAGAGFLVLQLIVAIFATFAVRGPKYRKLAYFLCVHTFVAVALSYYVSCGAMLRHFAPVAYRLNNRILFGAGRAHWSAEPVEQ